jgi:phospholipid/cholesterol/gamma-HCH transport system substrate-binding protein
MQNAFPRRRILGLAFIAVLVFIVAGVIAAYQQVFISYIPVAVQAPRSGLLMDAGADVTMHGVVVGKVNKVSANGTGALLDVGIYPDKIDYIRSSSVASIIAPTVFGAKYVSLSTPTEARNQPPIVQGTLIQSKLVGTETNDLLANLNTLLTTVNVSHLNSALGAVATTLRGRGDEAGRLLTDLNSYVAALNPSVPTLTSDLGTAADVTKVYAAATPDLARTVENLSVTSRTLVAEQSALPQLLASLTNTSNDTRELLDRNGKPLERMLEVLRPTTSMLADYSPVFPCLFASINQQRMHLDKIMGYQYAGLHMYDQLYPGAAPYKYPRDLTRIVPATPPSCYGGPIKPADAPVPYVRFADGSNNFVPSDSVTVAPRSPLSDPPPTIGPPGHESLPSGGGHPGGNPGILAPSNVPGHVLNHGPADGATTGPR